MLNYKSFERESLMALIKRYKFDSIDNDAFIRIVLVMEVLVFNMLNNVKHVTSALNVKTITKKHFEMVMNVINEFKNQQKYNVLKKGQKGGTVLPSEYFGTDSGRYYPFVDGEQSIAPTVEYARPAIDYHVGGANVNAFVTKTQVKFLVDAYKKAKKQDFRMSASAYEVIIECLERNLKLLLSMCKKHGSAKKTLTLQCIGYAINNQFPYMAYKLKDS